MSKDETMQVFSSGTGAVPYWSEGLSNQSWADGWYRQAWYSPIQAAPKWLLNKANNPRPDPTESKDVVELKVHFCCQEGFERKLGSALDEVEGIMGWHSDRQHGKVIVRVFSAKQENILKAVQRVDRRAEIWKDPKKTKN